MLTKRYAFITVLCGLCLGATGMADELMIFPNADQSAEQQEGDKFACYSWAKGESGFDPMAPPTATAPPPKEEPKKGGGGKGLVRGAAVGQLAGGSSKSTKRGAASGAAVGGMRSQNQKKEEEQKRQQWEQEQVQIYTENRNRYNRAYAACLEGKNYTVR